MEKLVHRLVRDELWVRAKLVVLDMLEHVTKMTCPPKAVPVRKLGFGTIKGGNNAHQALYPRTNHSQAQRG